MQQWAIKGNGDEKNATSPRLKGFGWLAGRLPVVRRQVVDEHEGGGGGGGEELLL